MKSTKTYIIVSTVFQIIFSLYLILAAGTVANEYNLTLQEEIAVGGLTNNDVITFGAINLFANIILGALVLKNGVIKRKWLLIILLAVSFMMTAMFGNITPWLALIGIITLICTKEKKEDHVDAKPKKQKVSIKELEKTLRLDTKRMTKKEIILVISLVIVYLFQLLPTSVLPESPNMLLIYIISIYVLLFVLAMVAFWNEIKSGFKIIRPNIKKYFKYVLKVFAVMFAIYYLAIFTTFIAADKTTSVNQEVIEMLPPIIIAPLAILWAPIVEESIFRGSIRKIIKNDGIYIFVSAILFGLMHTLGEATLELAIATAIPYAVLGGTFAYMYAKTNNLTGCIISHSMYNALGVLFMIL